VLLHPCVNVADILPDKVFGNFDRHEPTRGSGHSISQNAQGPRRGADYESANAMLIDGEIDAPRDVGQEVSFVIILPIVMMRRGQMSVVCSVMYGRRLAMMAAFGLGCQRKLFQLRQWRPRYGTYEKASRCTVCRDDPGCFRGHGASYAVW